jgi:hypothetical protein
VGKDLLQRQRTLMLWLLPVLLGLMAFAAALGYFLGRQSH